MPYLDVDLVLGFWSSSYVDCNKPLERLPQH
jgi:hypothetical protein